MKKWNVILKGMAAILVVALVASCSKYKDDLEPNDKRSEAVKIDLGQIYDASFTKNDDDWYEFTTENDGYWDIVSINITNMDDIVIGFEVYDALGNLGIQFTGERGADVPFNMYTPGGTFYIKIFSKTPSEKGNYSFIIANTDSNDELEPDDTFDDARVIDPIPTGLLSGTVLWSANDTYTTGDWEYFFITVKAGKAVDIDIDPVPADFIMNFEVYDEARNLVNAGYEGDPGEIVETSVINQTVDDRKIYLKVGGTLGNTFDGSYFISFVESDAN
jgi:hypothetical protein